MSIIAGTKIAFSQQETATAEKNRSCWVISNSHYPNAKFNLNTALNIKQSKSIDTVVTNKIDDTTFEISLDGDKNHEGILDKLRSQYYEVSKNDKPKPKEDRFSGLLKQIKDSFVWPRFDDELSLKQSNRYINRERIYGLSTPSYIIPIFGPKVLDFLDGPPHFYPEFSDILNVYKTDNDETFPLKLKGVLVNNDGGRQERAVYIFFHGFRIIYKWHYDIWKHFDRSNAVFHQCNFDNKDEEKKTCCFWDKCLSRSEDKIDYSRFNAVHTVIKQKCQEYFNKFVTHFKNSQTIPVYAKVAGNDMQAFTIELPLQPDAAEFRYELLVCNGVSYNFDSQMPTLHITPLTLYDINQAKYVKRSFSVMDTISKGFYLKNISVA